MGETSAGRPRRWWWPGVSVALAAAAVAGLLAEAWYAYEAGGCGDPREKFTCLGEAVVGGAAVLVLSPPLLWLAYRTAGVRRPLPSLLVAVAVGVLLQALPVLVRDVAALAGAPEPALDGSGSAWAVAVVVGPAVLAGGLAWSGPRRGVRAATGAVALGALAASTLMLQPVVGTVRDEREALSAGTPLVLAPGWRWLSPYASERGLGYDVVPAGSDGGDRLDVEVSRDLDQEGWACGVDPCRRVGEVTVSEPTEGTGTVYAWRVLDGHLVEVRGREPGTHDPLAFLTVARVVAAEDFLAARGGP